MGVSMEYQGIMARAAAWMQARGWKGKLAKRRGFEQSLFEHSLIELDVLLEMPPILQSPRHYGLSETEKKLAKKRWGERDLLEHRQMEMTPDD
jgi:hypothetical protein